MDIQEQIQQQVTSNPVFLYMKGTPAMPQCGFSQRAVQLLQACGATFESADVLADDAVREGVKQFSNWPTIPQLYINGKFVGGSDIMMELYQKGELQKMVADAGK
ncbi:MAG: Grx4 family monothiol glutaredoxin [Nitrospirota bacterium]|jgi:monothiol glutaredoxin